ncbi:alginate lyase family protein [Parasediminibacterium sp. JCM 36343]|uniref:alginate lyase family protein n=1 Tax=Parasediminibacterium sp. JCM 36343 TaxID=3374279 RepID=UPI00397D595F
MATIKKKTKGIHCLIIIMLSCLGWCNVAYTQVFVHPGIPFTTYDLDQLRANIKKEPWKSAYRVLEADPHSRLSYTMQGPLAYVTRSPHVNRSQWLNDMQAIHHLTFMWVFTKDADYAKKATEMLNDWAVTNTFWGGDEAILDLGDWVQYYATAADILKSTYPGWTASTTANVRNYFANVLWPTLDVPNPVRGANQGADAIKAAIGIAVFLDDSVKFNQAIASLRGDPAGGLGNSLSNGQVGDCGRDEGHTAGQIWNLAWAAEVAWKQGIDIFGDLDNRLQKTEELYARYNIDTSGVKYIRFGNPYECYWNKFGWTGNARRSSPSYNIIQAAYAIRKSIPTPYTEKLRDMVKETKNGFLYRKSADTSTARLLPPIIHPFAVSECLLKSIDIGNTGLAGTSTKNGGTWTVKGAGADIPIPSSQDVPDAFQFTYKMVKGDAVMIAQVTSIENTNSEARAGLMLRESLAPNAKYVGIFLQPEIGIKTTWRGATAFCKTDVSWAIPTQTPRNYEFHERLKAPYWLKIERLGNRVTVYHSLDAINWTCLENVEILLPTIAYIGLCVTSHDISVLNTATFSDVAVGDNNK